ncbi:hypothetical protein TIFTF001_036856 [Ficus carica]|uniref:Uncharacterized protein n=1 Tax=Ficus carica TaxID=3494 RepID=A0AA88E4H2_FICCA|nr:hypothetical protein TIFTF001_036856 [Ficus carica]
MLLSTRTMNNAELPSPLPPHLDVSNARRTNVTTNYDHDSWFKSSQYWYRRLSAGSNMP